MYAPPVGPSRSRVRDARFVPDYRRRYRARQEQRLVRARMNLQPTPEDIAFRAEVRQFVREKLPTDIRERVIGLRRIEREDYVR